MYEYEPMKRGSTTWDAQSHAFLGLTSWLCPTRVMFCFLFFSEREKNPPYEHCHMGRELRSESNLGQKEALDFALMITQGEYKGNNLGNNQSNQIITSLQIPKCSEKPRGFFYRRSRRATTEEIEISDGPNHQRRHKLRRALIRI